MDVENNRPTADIHVFYQSSENSGNMNISLSVLARYHEFTLGFPPPVLLAVNVVILVQLPGSVTRL